VEKPINERLGWVSDDFKVVGTRVETDQELLNDGPEMCEVYYTPRSDLIGRVKRVCVRGRGSKLGEEAVGEMIINQAEVCFQEQEADFLGKMHFQARDEWTDGGRELLTCSGVFDTNYGWKEDNYFSKVGLGFELG
jgi:hypothetical protein